MLKKESIKKIAYVHVITCTRNNNRLKYAVNFYTPESDARLNKNAEKVLNKIRSLLQKAKVENYQERIMQPADYFKFNALYEAGEI